MNILFIAGKLNEGKVTDDVTVYPPWGDLGNTKEEVPISVGREMIRKRIRKIVTG